MRSSRCIFHTVKRETGRGDEGEKKNKVIEGRRREKKREDEGEEGTEGGRIKW